MQKDLHRDLNLGSSWVIVCDTWLEVVNNLANNASPLFNNCEMGKITSLAYRFRSEPSSRINGKNLEKMQHTPSHGQNPGLSDS